MLQRPKSERELLEEEREARRKSAEAWARYHAVRQEGAKSTWLDESQVARVKLGETRVAAVSVGGPTIQGALLASVVIITVQALTPSGGRGWAIATGPAEAVTSGGGTLARAKALLDARSEDWELYVQDSPNGYW